MREQKSDIERFWAKVKKTETCWIWIAGKTRGYGCAWFNKKRLLTHRISYELHKGPIPNGMVIDHLCRNPACVNPEHLQPVTARENTLRGLGISANNLRKSHCINGHFLRGQNIYDRDDNRRVCILCAKQERDTISKAIGPTRSKNHCINGHEYTKENTRINSKGYRICRECHKKTANLGPHKDRTRCKNGHKFTKKTIYLNKRGIRECQICRNHRAELRYEKIKAIKLKETSES